jgi:hypothetical protein
MHRLGYHELLSLMGGIVWVVRLVFDLRRFVLRLVFRRWLSLMGGIARVVRLVFRPAS